MSTELARSAYIAVQDMEEMQTRGEWKMMKDTAIGWLGRQLLPDHNV